ncbi:MAG: response regulator [Planctomycetota bacterium]|nr:MAG: response regulator [Planctomycetota bacterium]
MSAPGARQTDLLLVDNDARILELVAWFLERRGFSVRTALSFREARASIAARAPDLLLSDIDLGAENAREELPRLAALGLLPPTLVVSGYLDADLVVELEALPQVIGTLAKPYDFAVLEERVRACCAQLAGAGAGAGAGASPVVTGAGEGEGDVEDDTDDDGWIEIVPQDPAAGRARAPARAPESGSAAGPMPFRLS